MNGKKARNIRKSAEAQTIGQKYRSYRKANDSSLRQTFDSVTGLTNTITPPGTFKLTAGCTRGVYKQMKRKIKQ